MVRKFIAVIEIAGEEMARSRPMPADKAREWLQDRLKQYRKLVECRPWRTYLITESILIQRVKTK